MCTKKCLGQYDPHCQQSKQSIGQKILMVKKGKIKSGWWGLLQIQQIYLPKKYFAYLVCETIRVNKTKWTKSYQSSQMPDILFVDEMMSARR